MIADKQVLRILERTDIDASDKILLIYILSRESEPTLGLLKKDCKEVGVRRSLEGLSTIKGCVP